MTSFIVAYDLRNESGSQDYEKLADALAHLHGHRAQESFWLVASSSTVKEVHDYLKKHIDSDDRLWVSELTKQHFFSNAMGGTNDWLKKHPPLR